MNMPVLILLGIGAVCGITALVSKHKPSQKYDINMSEQEKTKRVFENNNKRIDKIMRKYRWWNVSRCSSCHSAGMGYIRLSETLYTSSTANRWLRRTYQNTVTNEQPERTSTVSQAKKQTEITYIHTYTYTQVTFSVACFFYSHCLKWGIILLSIPYKKNQQGNNAALCYIKSHSQFKSYMWRKWG